MIIWNINGSIYDDIDENVNLIDDMIVKNYLIIMSIVSVTKWKSANDT